MKKSILKIGNKFESLLIAETDEEQNNGLMFIKTNPPIMLFSFNDYSPKHFWMKNTYIPLDIVFLKDSKVIAIEKGNPHSEELVGGHFANSIIEFPFNYCKYNNIKIGTVLEWI